MKNISYTYIMGYSNGQVQSSSDSGKAQKGDPGLPGIGFNLTDDGNFDLDGKRLTDVADPVDNRDAVTKGYVDTKNSQQNIAINSKAEKAYVDSENSKQDIAINSKAEKTDVLLLDGTHAMSANFDMNNYKIYNLANGTSDGDVVNFSQLKTHTDSHLNKYHLQKSFTFFKNFGDQAQLTKSNLSPFFGHNHHGLYRIRKEGSDPGFNGEAWVSLKMTNYLAVGIYTVVFETFSGTSFLSPSNITQLNNETLLQQVHGDVNFKIINFSHDYQTTHSKAYIQFSSNGQAGEITFKIRYYGSSYNNSRLYFFFYSRVISGKIGTAFNHALFDVDDVQLKNQILYFEDVNLNENKIKGLAAPSEDKDGANKKYVDDQIKAIPAVDTADLLKLDGTRAMTGNLQMGDHTITGIRSSSADNAALTVGASKSLYLPISGIRGMQGNLNMGGQSIVNLRPFVEIDSAQPAQDNQVINFGYFHTQRGYLKRLINEVASDALNRKSPDPMLDPIDMGNNFITNVKDPLPSNSHYGATVNFVNKSVSDNNTTMTTNYQKYIDNRLKHTVQSAETSNAFQYVMDDPAGQFYDEDDIKGIKKTNKDYHKINKETYEMQLLLDSIGYYSSRLGVNMYILPNGEYSLVYELYYPNSIDSNTVQISAVSSVETVSKVMTNVFSNYTRSIIHLHKYNNVAPNRLMIDMVLKNKAGVSYANELTIFVIVYGVSGYVNNVDTSVWDKLFEVTNNTIKFEAAIDMNKFDISNVDNLSINTLLNMNSKVITGLGDGVENGDAVNVKQLNDVESDMGKYIKAEITKVDTSLKKYFNDHLNNAIAEYGYGESLICVFYLDNNQFNNGDKIANLPDKKSFMPIYDANQSVESRKPTADNDLVYDYLYFRDKQCLTVDYNLNGKNNLNVFIVFRIIEVPGATLNGIFGNDNGGNIDRYIAVRENRTPKELRIGYGNGHVDVVGFPPKANPTTLNFSVLSVHYNTPDVNDSLVYCNGKYVSNITGETSTGQNTFSIGSIKSNPKKYTSYKDIAYFALYHGRFSRKDILIQHKYLCEKYKIDHDPITIP